MNACASAWASAINFKLSASALASMSRASASLRAFHGASIGPATAPMPLAV